MMAKYLYGTKSMSLAERVNDLEFKLAEANEKAKLQKAIDKIEKAGGNIFNITIECKGKWKDISYTIEDIENAINWCENQKEK